MLAVALLLALAPQAAPAAAAAPTRWEHVLVRHESFEDFFADGMASAYRAELNADAPVAITTGHVHGGSEQIDTLWDQDAASRAPEWLDGFYESKELVVPGGFQEALASWNANCPAGSGLCFELRVRENGDAPWSPWLYVGDWGEPTPPPLYLRRADPGGPRVDPRAAPTVQFEGGKIHVDYFTSEKTWTRAQYRVRTHTADPENARVVRLRRVALCFSRKSSAAAPSGSAPVSVARLAVPFRSQRTEQPELAGRICSPTSVAMLLAFRGVELPTLAVAQRVYDQRHDIYGNWTRAVQGAYSFGVPGYVTRIAQWSEVEQLLGAGQPLVISIAAAKGELAGAPYDGTDGHLLVLCGLEGPDRVLVNDPAAADAEHGALAYRRPELERVWMARGGTCYVFLPRER